MPPHDVAIRQPFRARHDDELLLEGGDQVTTQQPEVDNDRPDGKDEAGQDHGVEVADRILGERDVAARSREHMEVDREDQHSEHDDDEWGKRQHCKAGRCGHSVEQAVGLLCGGDGQGNRHRQSHNLGDHDQLEVNRERIGQRVGDGLMGDEGLPKIAVENIAEPQKIL